MSNLFHVAVTSILGIAVAGGIAYWVLSWAAVYRFARVHSMKPTLPASFPPISLLKPVSGHDPSLEKNLESFFRQDYPEFEILFSLVEQADPAIFTIHEVKKRYPRIPCRLVTTGEGPYPNAKVYGLEKLSRVAKHDLLVITDDDVSVSTDYLQAMAQEFQTKEVGAVTNLYRGIGRSNFWSKLEALGMSTEFMAGVVVAQRLEGMKFALGPSMAIRSRCLEKIGGFAALAEYLADDFVLGKKVFESGYRIALSGHVVNHHAYSTGFWNSFVHRLRWNRSARFSRPAGYFGQGFTYALPWAALLWLAAPSPWTLAGLICSLLLRLWTAYQLGTNLLGDRAVLGRLWLVPLQDFLSFVSWVAGFCGREVVWRNQRYQLLQDGRMAPLSRRAAELARN